MPTWSSLSETWDTTAAPRLRSEADQPMNGGYLTPAALVAYSTDASRANAPRTGEIRAKGEIGPGNEGGIPG